MIIIEKEGTEQSPYRWVILALGFLINFFVLAWLMFSIPIFLPEIEEVTGAPVSRPMLIFSSITFALIFSNLVGGILGDKYPLKWVVGIGGIVAGLSSIMRCFMPSFLGLVITSLIYGGAVGFFFPNIIKGLSEWFSLDQLGLAQGINLVGVNLGGGIVTTISPNIVKNWLGGWQNVFMVYGLIAVAVSVAWILLFRSHGSEEENAETGQPSEGKINRGAETKGSIGSVFEIIKGLIKNRVTFLLSGLLLFILFAFNGYVALLPTWEEITTFSVPPFVIGSVFYSRAIGSFAIPSISDKVGRKKTFYFAVLCSVLGILLTVLASSSELFALGVVITGISVAGLIPLTLAIPGDHPKVDIKQTGSMVGAMYSVGQVGGTISPVLAGEILVIYGLAWSGLALALPLLFVIPLVWSIKLRTSQDRT